jgi:hypothetical protein
MMAPSPTIPTTTPAAMPAVLGLLFSLGAVDGVVVGDMGPAVAVVVDDGFADDVDELETGGT